MFLERVVPMALPQATKAHETAKIIDHAMDVLLSRLDGAI